jgi:mannose/cellobiose epimerase-like protein (N-acyl-D-glucosamine 2-epimerase family)
MSDSELGLIRVTREWLQEVVFPHWLQVGIDSGTQLFIENLSFEGKPLKSAKRALVQARQIYSIAEGARLSLVSESQSKLIISSSSKAFLKYFQLPSGAFVHSIDEQGQHLNLDNDLYSQAFALFALAHAFESSKNLEFKVAANKLVHFLSSERRNINGGFTEIKNGKVLYQSNPHMHLFESALAWMKIDSDPVWKNLASELQNLCVNKFIDSKTELLAENFDEKWQPLLEKGHFIFEPGHQFEWSWLLFQYDSLRKLKNETKQSRRLFELAEKFGVTNPSRALAFDEIWSDGRVHKRSSRFWPQCERIKAAVVLGEGKIADIAMQALIENFLMLKEGLWKDTLLESGEYGDQPVKASSLYHIINAISEYAEHRPKIAL